MSRLRSIFRNQLGGRIGFGIVIFMILFSFAGPLIYRTDQVHTSIEQATLAPSAAHPLGTNEVGYDVLGRLMLGGQTSLEVGVAAALIATSFGVLWVLGTIVTPSVPVLVVVIGAIAWLVPARLIRAETLSLRTREFVDAVRVMGGSEARIVLRHILPNAIGTVVVNATFQVADAILTVAALSFLGLGVPPPAANWGSMLSSGVNYTFAGYWWLIYPAGIAIVLTVVAFNVIGDALRESLDVRLRI